MYLGVLSNPLAHHEQRLKSIRSLRFGHRRNQWMNSTTTTTLLVFEAVLLALSLPSAGVVSTQPLESGFYLDGTPADHSRYRCFLVTVILMWIQTLCKQVCVFLLFLVKGFFRTCMVFSLGTVGGKRSALDVAGRRKMSVCCLCSSAPSRAAFGVRGLLKPL